MSSGRRSGGVRTKGDSDGPIRAHASWRSYCQRDWQWVQTAQHQDTLALSHVGSGSHIARFSMPMAMFPPALPVIWPDPVEESLQIAQIGGVLLIGLPGQRATLARDGGQAELLEVVLDEGHLDLEGGRRSRRERQRATCSPICSPVCPAPPAVCPAL